MGDVKVRNDHAADLPPILLSQDLQESLDKSKVDTQPGETTGAPGQDELGNEIVTINEQQLETVLKMMHSLGAMYYGDPEIWNDEEFEKDLEYLKPLGTAWSNKRQWAAKLVTAVEEEAFPMVLGYTFGKRIMANESKKKEAKNQKPNTLPIVPKAQQGGAENVRNVPLTFG